MIIEMNLVIVDDHQFVIDEMKLLLHENPGMQVIGEANSILEAKQLLLKLTEKLDVLICDLHLPDGNGIELVKWAEEHLPEVKVLVLTMNDEPETIRNVLDANANGYLIKRSPAEELIKAVNQVNEGLIYYGKRVKELLNKSSREKLEYSENPFSDREIDVLQLIAEEYSANEIGEKLFISHHTVNTHRKNMLRKIEAKSIVSLIRFGIRHQLISA